MKENQKIWFITGVSGGIGLALMKEVLSMGDIVIGSVRQEKQLELTKALHPTNAHAVLLDVTNFEQATSVVQQIIAQFGRIDVLVNNAGFGYFGAIEELTLDECRTQFETNFFGVIHLTQQVLPHMRNQQAGQIVQVSSVAGFRSAAGLGIYNASKFALEGLSEAMFFELQPLNIHVMLVEPGPFRTEFAGSSSAMAQRSISDYDATSGNFKRMMQERNGQQAGDPVKGAKKIIKALSAEHPPLRLPLGRQAMEGIQGKMDWVKRDIQNWEADILDTDFENQSLN